MNIKYLYNFVEAETNKKNNWSKIFVPFSVLNPKVGKSWMILKIVYLNMAIIVRHVSLENLAVDYTLYWHER